MPFALNAMTLRRLCTIVAILFHKSCSKFWKVNVLGKEKKNTRIGLARKQKESRVR
jgi:hypothetical protein